MDRRTLAGTAVTAAAVVTGVVADFLAEADLLPLLLAAGAAGGLLAGGLSRESGHVGAGARAGAYGGAVGFLGFVAVGLGQSLGGGPPVLVLGAQTLLIAVLVVPVYALSGAVAAAVGVRLRRAGGRETAS